MDHLPKTRLEAFSDGVIAIIITVMVLELRAPASADLSALAPLVPDLMIYALSFLYLAIYWNNHHHLLHATKQIDGRIMWANLYLLFWLSLFPFVTAWVGRMRGAAWPTAFYGVVSFMAALAYYFLQLSILALQGRDSALARALGSDWKGKLSPILYLAAIGLAFVSPWISEAIYIIVAAIWFVPDRRIERLTK